MRYIVTNFAGPTFQSRDWRDCDLVEISFHDSVEQTDSRVRIYATPDVLAFLARGGGDALPPDF